MKSTTTTLNANLKEMKQIVKFYAKAEKEIYNARNCRDFDKAKEDMATAFRAMMGVMKDMISDVNVLGVSCGEVDIRKYYRISEFSL